MPTIIDALALQLTLDRTDLEQGLKQVVENLRRSKDQMGRHLKGVDEATKKTAMGIKELGVRALEFFGIILSTRAIKEFIEQTTAANISMGRLSHALNADVKQLGSWEILAERAGSSAGKMRDSFQGVGDMIETAAKQGKALPDAFGQIMSASHKTIRANQGIVTTMEDLAEALHEIDKHDPQLASTLGRQLPIDPMIVHMMTKYGAGIHQAAKEVENLVPTAQMIKNSQDLQSAWASVAQSASIFFQKIADIGSGPMQVLLTQTKSLFDYLNKWLDKVRAIDWKKPAPEPPPGLRSGEGSQYLEKFKQWLFGPGIMNQLGQPTGPLSKGGGGELTYHGAPLSDSNAIPVKITQAPPGGKNWFESLVDTISSGVQATTDPTGTAGGGFIHGLGKAFGNLIGVGGGGGGSGKHGRVGEKLTAIDTGNDSATEAENYIRQKAKELGIDPNVAVGVAKSEGGVGAWLPSRVDFDAEGHPNSWGHFQLHRGGLADQFEAETHLKADDPKYWRQQDEWALRYARKYGWRPWHGWHGAERAGIGPAPEGATPAQRHMDMINAAVRGTHRHHDLRPSLRHHDAAAWAHAAKDAISASGSVTTMHDDHSNNQDVKIGNLMINAPDSDARSIASAFYSSLDSRKVANAADYGAV